MAQPPLTIAEKARQYAEANGGHTATAAALVINLNTLRDFTSGRRAATTQLAVKLSPVLGVPIPLILADNVDLQLSLRAGRH